MNKFKKRKIEYKEKDKKERNRNNEKGITMISLVMSIAVLGILTVIVLDIGTNQVKQNVNKALEIELDMVYNAVLQRYVKESVTTQDYPGRVPTEEEFVELETVLDFEVLETQKEEYYVLEPGEESVDLGILNNENVYIINYKSGIVYNLTVNETEEGQLLYRSNV